jgi:hypothetical protein
VTADSSLFLRFTTAVDATSGGNFCTSNFTSSSHINGPLKVRVPHFGARPSEGGQFHRKTVEVKGKSGV